MEIRKNEIRIRADKSSRKAFKVTSNVKTSVLQILEELWVEDGMDRKKQPTRQSSMPLNSDRSGRCAGEKLAQRHRGLMNVR